MRQVLWLHKHTTSAIKERVRIPAHSLGLVVKVKENDTAIVKVAGLGQVELRVQDLTHVSLVINEVDCFKYLGLQLDYALRMEEATKTGVANVRFAHSKVAATLPPQGRMAAFVNHLYDDLARNLFTPAPYLRSLSGILPFPNSHARSEHHPFAGPQTQRSAPNTILG
jgi:hypothetical protein